MNIFFTTFITLLTFASATYANSYSRPPSKGFMDNNSILRNSKTTNYYDSQGRPSGHTEQSYNGGYNYYDAQGRPSGHAERSFTGGYNYYDAQGRPAGYSK